ncbi:MAG: hypothetical protein NVS3B6_18670 [Pseudarthrobacter sp.]
MLPLGLAIVSFTTDRGHTVKKALATLGVAGLALFSVTAPVYATDSPGNGQVSGGNNQHAGNGTNGNTDHGSGNNGNGNGNGSDHGNGNGNGNGHGNGNGNGNGNGDDCTCHEETPPVETPPVETPPVETPPVEQPPTVVPPVVQPPTGLVIAQAPVVVPPAARPPAARPPAARPPVAVSKGTNQGFNAQTAAGGAEDSNTWLAGMGMLLGAGVVVTVRRRSRSDSSPTAL